MREIKFRAWDKEYNQMMDAGFFGINEYITPEGSVVETETHSGYGFSDMYMIDISDRRILMQYTGLKDKNGTEIYEGDIFALEVPYACFETGDTIYEKEYIPVTFEDGKYVLYEQGIRNHNLCDVLTGWRIREGYKCNGEVIGNIYEHKHLLEAE